GLPLRRRKLRDEGQDRRHHFAPAALRILAQRPCEGAVLDGRGPTWHRNQRLSEHVRIRKIRVAWRLRQREHGRRCGHPRHRAICRDTRLWCGWLRTARVLRKDDEGQSNGHLRRDQRRGDDANERGSEVHANTFLTGERQHRVGGPANHLRQGYRGPPELQRRRKPDTTKTMQVANKATFKLRVRLKPDTSDGTQRNIESARPARAGYSRLR